MKTHNERPMASGAFSLLRVLIMVVGVLALIPLTILFGIFGFIGGLFFLLLAAFAKA